MTSLSDSQANIKAPLEDLMVAMDVVDTIRHQHDIAERELDGKGRQDRLLERLKELYQAQGIAVPEHILQEGIDAIEQERFQYQAVESNWQIKLARLWVSRTRWGKPVGFLSVLGGLFYGVYFVSDVLPEQRIQDGLPAKIEAAISTVSIISKNEDLILQAKEKGLTAKHAISNNDYATATDLLTEIESVNDTLRQEYTIRVVSKPGVSSGVWRVPDVNESGRNYYLIVEAIGRDNSAIQLNILNEETNKLKLVSRWGLRVNETTFYKVAGDKQDDGIIQLNKVGVKQTGYLKPKYSIPTTGATITDW